VQLQNPLAVITPTLDAGVLRVLAAADSSFTGRQVARLLPQYSQKGVHNTLQRLAEQGIVLRDVAGASHLYRLNRRHLAADHIRSLAHLRDEFDRRVSAEVAAWRAQPEVVILFGSAAQGEMATESDIDLFVVGDEDGDPELWQQQLATLADQATAWTGNDTRVLDMPRGEVRAAIAEGDPLIAAIRDEGQVLHGDSRYLNKLALDTRGS
jgi:predicted nucleotidyltransferase